MLANLIGFLFDGTASPERTELVTALKQELTDLRNEYFSMLYGGRVGVKVVAGCCWCLWAAYLLIVPVTTICMQKHRSEP